MLIVNDEEFVGEALSGLPFIYYMAAIESRKSAPLYILFRNVDVFDLIPARVRRQLSPIVRLEDLFETQPPFVEQRIAHLAVGPCRTRYGHRYHMMHAHFVNHGFYPDKWEPPLLDIGATRDAQAFDFIIAPHSRDSRREAAEWPHERWQQLVDRLSQRFRVCVIGEAGRLPQFRGAAYFGFDRLRDVCGAMSNVGRAVISLDNDCNHLAHALRVPHCDARCW